MANYVALRFSKKEAHMLGPKRVGPFMGVQDDCILTFPNGRSFRLVTYQAYNAQGLIGSESNGIAVLDEDAQRVVVDEIARQTSGYFGVSAQQKAEWTRLTDLSWPAFRKFVNSQPRLRKAI